MAYFNILQREIKCKLVYYGPGLCGKTTNLIYIHEKANPEAKGNMITLNTEQDRTLFFDFFPLSLGEINGFKLTFQLYTVPGQVFYDSSRKLILKGVDGLVFVADSQFARLDANEESLENLTSNLAEHGYRLQYPGETEYDENAKPFVIQYNKRDMPGALPVEELRETLNPHGVPDFEAVAVDGTGVNETLKAVAKLVFKDIKRSSLVG